MIFPSLVLWIIRFKDLLSKYNVYTENDTLQIHSGCIFANEHVCVTELKK